MCIKIIYLNLFRYALNVIGSVIFGLEVDTIKEPKHSFRTIERMVNNPSISNLIKGIGVFLCPKY